MIDFWGVGSCKFWEWQFYLYVGGKLVIYSRSWFLCPLKKQNEKNTVQKPKKLYELTLSDNGFEMQSDTKIASACKLCILEYCVPRSLVAV